MSLEQQFRMYRLAYHLVANYGYEVLHIDEKQEEIWLEKLENKTSKVIRFVQQGFDWKNYLKRDIAIVFQKTKAMKRLLPGKHVEIHNVYISAYSPIDDWEMLKKPMKLNEKNPLTMQVYYLDEQHYNEEQEKFKKAVGAPQLETDNQIPDVPEEECINQYKTFLTGTLYDKRDEVKKVLSFGKPFFTYLLLIMNVILFIFLEINGGSENIENLIQYGASFNPAIIDGEWWRIVSSMFLHIGMLHLFMNMLALFYLGTTAERIYGSWRFLVIYFLAGIGGGLASFAFTVNVSAGASGAIFGLFGALLFFGLTYKKIFFQTMGKGLLILIGINVVFGFVVPQIDNGAHLGGLIAGFLASAIVHLPTKRKWQIQIPAFIFYTAVLAGLIIFGVQHNENNASYQLMHIDELIKEEDYEAVVESATKGLENPDNLEAHLLFQRSYAYIELNKYDLALSDLERSIHFEDTLPEAYYNLALLYNDDGEPEKAEEAIRQAYKLKPEDHAFINLYEQITGETVE